VSTSPAERRIVIVHALDLPLGPMFSKQTDGSRSETPSMNGSAWILPQGHRGDHIGCVRHSEESLPLGLPTCDIPMLVHPRAVPLASAVFHDGISDRPLAIACQHQEIGETGVDQGVNLDGVRWISTSNIERAGQWHVADLYGQSARSTWACPIRIR